MMLRPTDDWRKWQFRRSVVANAATTAPFSSWFRAKTLLAAAVTLLTLWTGFAGAATAHAAEVEAELKYNPDAAACLPFLPARLTVHNASAAAYDMVEVRASGGGPTIRQAITLPPKSDISVTMCLPAMEARETYAVRLGLAGKWDWHGTLAAQWPIEQADRARATMIDADVYQRWAAAGPEWPSWQKRLILIAMVLAGIGLAGTFLIRSTSIRLCVAGGVVTLATVACLGIIPSVPVVQFSQTTGQDRLMVVGALRSVRHEIETSQYRPVYRNAAQFRRDDLVIEPGKLIVKFVPDEMRVFAKPPTPTSRP